MGQISVAIRPPSVSEKQGAVAYSVTLHHSEQVRRYVGLSCLRSVLQPGNPCELWSQELKQWLPGQVQSLEARGGPLRYYKILLDDSSTVRRGEASQVRHSFPAGSKVLVYHGIERGWVPAEVSGLATGRVRDSLDWLDLHSGSVEARISDVTDLAVQARISDVTDLAVQARISDVTDLAVQARISDVTDLAVQATAQKQGPDVSETKTLAEYVVMVSVQESPLDASYEVPSSLVRWPSAEPEVQHIITDDIVTI